VYQSVDINDGQDPSLRQKHFKVSFKKFAIIATLLAAGFISFFIFFQTNQDISTKPATATDSQDSYNAYLTAISEPEAALRRARLQDFLKTYPFDTRSGAAQAQLDVLNAYETQDWNRITKIAYDNTLSHETRLNALETYNQDWGGNLLGGRAEDITILRANILKLPDTPSTIERGLNEHQSPIPDTIIGDKLLGEPQPRTYAPRTIVQNPIQTTEPKDIIVKPRVRRNVKPRYPRKALRRNISALVVLSLSVDAKGKVQMTEVVEANARLYEKDFIKAAERAALRTRYYPQTVNGEPVPVSGIVKRYRFRG
jgi:TonB family protein